MTLNKEDLYKSILTRLDKRELEEVLAAPKIAGFGLDTVPMKPKKTTGSTVSDFLQNTKDDYSKQHIVPHLINTDMMKYFGQLTPEQQSQLQQQAIDYSNKIKEVNWTQYFYNTDILRQKRVRLYTFLKKASVSSVAPTTESFYTNYACNLFEASISTTPGDRSGDYLFLNSNEETRAYVRADLESNLYVGTSSKGPRYFEFTQGHLTVNTEEARRVVSFSSSILEEIKAKVISELTPYFNSPSEKDFLNNISNNQLPLVFLDSLMFGLVDTLNFPSTKDYGTGHQAGNGLLGNPILSNSNIEPALSENIKNNLTKCIHNTNPYLKNISNLLQVMSKSRSKNTVYNSLTNVIIGNFANLNAKLASVCGVSNFDFTPIFCSEDSENRISTLISLGENEFFRSFSNVERTIPNPFIRLTFTKASLSYNKDKQAYLLMTKNVSGISCKSKSTERYSTTSNWHGLGIPLDQHNFILQKAQQDFGNIDASSYLSVLASLDTRGETAQNIYSGGSENSTAVQFQQFLASIYQSDGSFKTNFVVFALIPRIFFQYNSDYTTLKGFKSSTRPLHFSNLYDKVRTTTIDSVYTPVNPEVNLMATEDMELLDDIRDRFLQIMYNFNTTTSQVEDLKNDFIALTTNIINGYWTCDKFIIRHESDSSVYSQDLGLFNPLNEIKGDLQFNRELLEKSNILTLRENWISEQEKLREGK